jgi:hypothetical protein
VRAITCYRSVTGRIFQSAERALLDEAAIANHITSAKASLARLIPGTDFYGYGVLLTEEDVAEAKPRFENALARYEELWARAQAEKKEAAS